MSTSLASLDDLPRYSAHDGARPCPASFFGGLRISAMHEQGGHPMPSKLTIFGGIAAAVALSAAAHAQSLVSEKNISLAMAQTIANGAMDKCKELGFKVSVVVVDRAGLPIVMLRGDGAGLHTPEGADRKAYTARTFRAPSADFVKRMQNDPASVGSMQYTRVLALSGGLPIKAGDDVVG